MEKHCHSGQFASDLHFVTDEYVTPPSFNLRKHCKSRDSLHQRLGDKKNHAWYQVKEGLHKHQHQKSSDRKAETVLPICQRKPKAVMSKSKVIEKKGETWKKLGLLHVLLCRTITRFLSPRVGGGHESPSEEAVLTHEPLMGTTTPCWPTGTDKPVRAGLWTEQDKHPVPFPCLELFQ